ncbi:hypothetical protein EJB05_26712, partial [Eragrostis curvula]
MLLVQVTRFTCGSYVEGYTFYHLVGDGHAMAGYLVVGQQSRIAAAWPKMSEQRAAEQKRQENRVVGNCLCLVWIK